MSRSNALRAALAACALLVLAGCATSGSTASTAAAPAGVGGQVVVQDAAYMERVEQIARQRGIGVTWVNPPVKRRVATR